MVPTSSNEVAALLVSIDNPNIGKEMNITINPTNSIIARNESKYLLPLPKNVLKLPILKTLVVIVTKINGEAI